MNDRRERPEADWPFTFAVMLVALLPRLYVAIAWSREPVWDAHYYHFGAERIADGFGYSEDVFIGGAPVDKPWSHYPVGYSAFLALLYVIFGPGLLVAPVANAVIGALLVGAVHRVARHYLSVVRARIAAALAAWHPGLILYATVLMTEPLAALLLFVAMLATLRAGRWQNTVGAGAALGLATLVRPASLLVGPVLGLALRPRLARVVRHLAVVIAVALAVVMPWTLRNCVTMDGCAFVSTNAGWNLAIGAVTETGRFHTLRASDGCPVATGQVQQDRCWAHVGLERILQAPGRWLGLVPQKLAQTYDHESFPVEYLREADPGAWPEARRVAGRELLTGYHRILVVLAALGLVTLPERRRLGTTGAVAQSVLAALIVAWSAHAALNDSHPFYVLVAAIPLVALARLPGAFPLGPVGRFAVGLIFVTSLTHAVFFGDDRYHLIVTPALCILAAGALRRGLETATELLNVGSTLNDAEMPAEKRSSWLPGTVVVE